MRHESCARFYAGMMVVAALAAKDASPGGWREVVAALVEERGDMVCEVDSLVSDEIVDAMRLQRPRYVAFVMLPEELNGQTIQKIRRMMCRVDDDPFDDAIWGVVTGPTAEDAMRVALCRAPTTITSVLATTGVDEQLVDGPITVISDANPPGEWWAKSKDGSACRHSTTGDVSRVFADAWDSLDPDLLLTSSHASERNLEMPFGRGNIASVNGVFATVENLGMIDYSTGQAIEGLTPSGAAMRQLSAPKREKVWVAAGNCLIANHKPDGSDMIMCALGFGKVNQFVGYIKTTWFGEIGWNTWRYFASYGLPLNESWYAANQLLIKKLLVDDPSTHDESTQAGLVWDFDGTVFYGNPRRRVSIPSRERLAASQEVDAPLFLVFDDSKPGRRLVSAPDGFEVFVADDFAIITSWPNLAPNWRKSLIFE